MVKNYQRMGFSFSVNAYAFIPMVLFIVKNYQNWVYMGMDDYLCVFIPMKKFLYGVGVYEFIPMVPFLWLEMVKNYQK